MNLDAVRYSLLEAARARAAATADTARTDAAQHLAWARDAAGALLDQAKAAGASEAAALLHEADMRARRDSRRLVLEARRRAYDEARRAVREAALDLRSDPVYPIVLRHLRNLIAERLGEGAEFEVDPPEAGGVIGRLRTRTVDCTLTAVADSYADAGGDLFEELWR